MNVHAVAQECKKMKEFIESVTNEADSLKYIRDVNPFVAQSNKTALVTALRSLIDVENALHGEELPVNTLSVVGQVQPALAHESMLQSAEWVGGFTQLRLLNVPDTCMLSGRPMEDPVRSTLCGHYFDKPAITAYLKEEKERHRSALDVYRCPVDGCDMLLNRHAFEQIVPVDPRLAPTQDS
ncbi:Non-structural maintenance of chromosomes element 2 NSE2 [Carpediemonas membranifera]|uniref:Non-structural maintenance of chromosomes element 2 NSE2 n=1 Tax=Carpediemonas membranifera TaxID=201153 RepID=A0A8J6E125_9EUKA|nr:Non-structural maintenance of chromosomes element 2 NSE2 [Carpediemonas membranifera]|eukprot:KAG9392561.1 Non-structural maintenance of chromosomes element 2 NSE2 [Carpediemonas membranifera]